MFSCKEKCVHECLWMTVWSDTGRIKGKLYIKAYTREVTIIVGGSLSEPYLRIVALQIILFFPGPQKQSRANKVHTHIAHTPETEYILESYV